MKLNILSRCTFALLLCAGQNSFGANLPDSPKAVLELPPGPGNPRNSEGDIARLNDGRLLYIYSHYTKGTGGDHDPAILASRVSSDGGFTWSTTDETVVAGEGAMNVMSVSLERMRDGSLGLFYLVKNSEADCRPVLRRSTDEGRTWSAPVKCIPDAEVGYYVLNNSRVARLKSGRLVLPLSYHEAKNGKTSDWKGRLVTYISDDDGLTWRRGSKMFETFDAAGKRIATQEPGIVELSDGRALMYTRTDAGRQWFYYSSDGCETWTKGEPGSLVGPLGPATIRRLRSGFLVAVWNDHETYPQYAHAGPKWASGTRKPFSIALSKDEGRTWIRRKVVEDLPNGWYCYFSILEMNGYLLVSHCAEKGLAHSRITLVPLKWLAPPMFEKGFVKSAPNGGRHFKNYFSTYHDSAVYKIFLKGKGGTNVVTTLDEAMDIIRKIHDFSGGMHQIAYLVGWQYEGHDSKYPAWGEVGRHCASSFSADPLTSLRKMIVAARAYNADVSLHINMNDAYENSPLWKTYVEKGALCFDRNGRPFVFDTMGGEPCYWVSHRKDWQTGLAKERILGLLKMIPELRASRTIHIDALFGNPSEGDAITAKDDADGIDAAVDFWHSQGMDVSTEFLPSLDRVGYFPHFYHLSVDERRKLAYPPEVMCGGDGEWSRRDTIDYYHRDRLWNIRMPENGCAYEEAWGEGHWGDLTRGSVKDERAFIARLFSRTFLNVWYNKSRPIRYTVDAETYVVERANGAKASVRQADRALTVTQDGRFVAGAGDYLLDLTHGGGTLLAFSRRGCDRAFDLPKPFADAKTLVGKTYPGGASCSFRVKDGRASLKLGAGMSAVLKAESVVSPSSAATTTPAPKDTPPRKVLVGTVCARFSGTPEQRAAQVDRLVDGLAERARRDYAGRRLDLVVLPEHCVMRPASRAAEKVVTRAFAEQTLGAAAKRNGCYLAAGLFLAEEIDGKAYPRNCCALFDRQGQIVGVYNKVHTALEWGNTKSVETEVGIAPGEGFPVFETDFGKVGCLVCYDMSYPDGWAELKRNGAEIVAVASMSPQAFRPALFAHHHQYWVVTATPRAQAAVITPLGFVKESVGDEQALLTEIDLSYAICHWSPELKGGKALVEKFGEGATGGIYKPGEDNGIFWSNRPERTIGSMIEAINVRTRDAEAARADRASKLSREARRGVYR